MPDSNDITMSDKPAAAFESEEVYKLAEGVRIAREMTKRKVDLGRACAISAEHFKVALALLEQAEHHLMLAAIFEVQTRTGAATAVPGSMR